MENQEPAPNTAPPTEPLDSAPVVIEHSVPEKISNTACLLATVALSIWLAMMAMSDPATSLTPRNVISSVVMCCVLLAVSIWFTWTAFQCKLVFSHKYIVVIGLWKTTTIPINQITQIQWTPGPQATVYFDQNKITISSRHFDLKQQKLAISLMKECFTAKPQEGVDAAIAKAENDERISTIPIHISVPLLFIVPYIAGSIWAYLTYQITIALVMAILGVPPLIYVIWSEIRHRRKAAAQSQSDPNQSDT